MLNYQRVDGKHPINIQLNHYKIPLNPIKPPFSYGFQHVSTMLLLVQLAPRPPQPRLPPAAWPAPGSGGSHHRSQGLARKRKTWKR